MAAHSANAQLVVPEFGHPPDRCCRVVLMGVSGCGKSSLAEALAARTGMRWLEGDHYHSPHNRQKMGQGIALTDDDRKGWLEMLGQLLAQARQDTLLTCSALRRAYRQRLRSFAPDLRFVYLQISPEQARARVQARAGLHFFPGTLVDNQFATLEPPADEPGVLTLDAGLPLTELAAQTEAWLRMQSSDAVTTQGMQRS